MGGCRTGPCDPNDRRTISLKSQILHDHIVPRIRAGGIEPLPVAIQLSVKDHRVAGIGLDGNRVLRGAEAVGMTPSRYATFARHLCLGICPAYNVDGIARRDGSFDFAQRFPRAPLRARVRIIPFGGIKIIHSSQGPIREKSHEDCY